MAEPGALPEHSSQAPRRWRRRGRVFPAVGTKTPPWVRGYAALPCPVDEGGVGRARVYFSGRDDQNRANIGAVTVDLRTRQVVEGSLTEQPLLAPGSLGAFDDSGCSVGCVVPHRGNVHLYYTGWMLGRTVPFYFAIGLATSCDGGRSFERHSLAPVLDRDPVDPYLCASPSILVEDGLWRMWYISGQGWEAHPSGPRHYYLVRYAESDDGIHWRRDGRIALDFSGPLEYAIGRPHVVRTSGGYYMWFCSRGDRYRLGRARSSDGYRWTRETNAAALQPAPAAWDSEMQAYPSVFHRDDRWWLFYNGNGYGATGFGMAEGIIEEIGDTRA